MRQVLKKISVVAAAIACVATVSLAPAQAKAPTHKVSADLANVAYQIAARFGVNAGNKASLQASTLPPGLSAGRGFRAAPRVTPLTCDFDGDGSITAGYTTDHNRAVFQIVADGNEFPDFAGGIMDGVFGVPFNGFTWQPRKDSIATDCGPAVILVGVDSTQAPVIGIAFAGDGSSQRNLPGTNYFQETFFPGDFFYLTGTPTGTITSAVLAFGVLNDCGPQTDSFIQFFYNNLAARKNLGAFPCPLNF